MGEKPRLKFLTWYHLKLTFHFSNHCWCLITEVNPFFFYNFYYVYLPCEQTWGDRSVLQWLSFLLWPRDRPRAGRLLCTEALEQDNSEVHEEYSPAWATWVSLGVEPILTEVPPWGEPEHLAALGRQRHTLSTRKPFQNHFSNDPGRPLCQSVHFILSRK